MKDKEKYLQIISDIPNKYKEPVKLYRDDVFKTRGDESWISDAVAQKLADDIVSVIGSIASKTRQSSYNADHQKDYQDKSKTRAENVFAIWLCGNKINLGDLGKCIDYEIPLRDVMSDSFGEIDLLSYNSDKKALTLIELKPPKNTESINRAILEVSTYYQIVDKDKLLSDFHLPEDTKVEKAVLVYEDSVATRDFSPAKGRLADSLSVSIWTYGIDNIDYAPDNMPAIESVVTSRLH